MRVADHFRQAVRAYQDRSGSDHLKWWRIIRASGQLVLDQSHLVRGETHRSSPIPSTGVAPIFLCSPCHPRDRSATQQRPPRSGEAGAVATSKLTPDTRALRGLWPLRACVTSHNSALARRSTGKGAAAIADHASGVNGPQPRDPHPPSLPVLAAQNNSLTDRKSTRLNSSHANISYAVFCLKKK